MSLTLHKNSPAVKLLIKKIKRGTITEAQKPAEVWRSEALFQKHMLPAFRNRLYKLRQQIQTSNELLDEDEDDKLNRRCTEQQLRPRKATKVDDEEHDAVDIGEDDSVSCADESSLRNMFEPLFLILDWTEAGTMAKRLSLAILLPSGVGAGDFSVSVGQGGCHLDLLLCWPSALLHMATLHKKGLVGNESTTRLENYHPKILGFEAALKKKRKQATDIVESKANIHLPFQVETHIDSKHNLGCIDGNERILYVDLKAAVEDYAVALDATAFELV